MRKESSLAVPLLLLTALVATVLANIPEETGLPLGAQAQVVGYAASWYPSGGARIESVARAGQPWSLTRDGSLALFGTSVRFSQGYGQSTIESHYPQQLPYPPEEVWCVLLERGADVTAGQSPTPSYDLVVVALHRSLYEADWTVHIPREALPIGTTAKALAAIGCDLGLDYVGPLKAES
jgi:hypothetical protein